MNNNSLSRVDDVIAQVDMFLNQDIDPYPSNEGSVAARNFTMKQNISVDQTKQGINDLLMRAHVSPPPDPNFKPHIKIETENFNNFDPLNQSFETLNGKPGGIFIQKKFTGEADENKYSSALPDTFNIGSRSIKSVPSSKFDYTPGIDSNLTTNSIPNASNDLSVPNLNFQYAQVPSYLGSSKSEHSSKIQSAVDIEADILRQENDKLRAKLMEGKGKYQKLRETNNELLTRLERQQAELRHLKNRK